MNRLLDKLIILALCMAIYFQYPGGAYAVVPILAAVAAAALCSYLERDAVILAVFLGYSTACMAWPALFFFLPIVCYDVVKTRRPYALMLAVFPAAAGFEALPAMACAFALLFAALACVLRLRAASLEGTRSDYIRLRDSAKEFSMRLEGMNRELMEKQDYEINLATLNERNRIARDIHDSIGHLLSNSILQTGALMATCRDDALQERLATLKGTLAQGMDSIRDSIHGLYDDSVDLYAEVKALADNFRFCEITLDYGIESNPERKIKYALLAIVKEALSNVIRHSDATHVRLSLREHPALYQLAVRDNGAKAGPAGEGIGLKNIAARVEGLGGIVNIGFGQGFTVFASIPKERAHENIAGR
jgi:signal transduction histidine kinase